MKRQHCRERGCNRQAKDHGLCYTHRRQRSGEVRSLIQQRSEVKHSGRSNAVKVTFAGFPWGKYQGRQLVDIPRNYLWWVVNLRPNTKVAPIVREFLEGEGR